MNESVNETAAPSVRVVAKLGEALDEFVVREGTLTGDLAGRLAPKWRGHIIVAVNGRIAGPDLRLKRGDRVVVLPGMDGG